MQGHIRMDLELLDAGALAGDLLPAGSVFAFLAEHRHELFPDEFTADLFVSRTGRPSLPADLVGSVLVLKELCDYSDTQTAEALTYDLRWKVACGRSLTQTSFDPSTLVHWRRRIAKSKRPDRVFDAVARVIASTGIMRGRRKRLVDSTVFDDAVATQDTVTQLVAAIRKVARVVPGAGEVIARVATLDYTRAGKPPIDWDDPEAKQNLVSDLVNDALAILAELTGEGAPERDDTPADALGLLALVAGQDVEPADGSDGTDGRWRIARKVAHDRVISTVDTQARHTRKSKSKCRDGFRGHLAAEPDTGLITDCEMTKAAGDAGSDPVVGEQMISRDRYHNTNTGTADQQSTGPEPADPGPADPGPADAQPVGAELADPEPADTEPAAPQPGRPEQADTEPADTEPADPEPVTDDADTSSASAEPAAGQRPDAAHTDGKGLEVYGDSAYGTGQARAAYRDRGHDTVIKPKPLRPAVDGGFTLDDFGIDEGNGTVTCPAGKTRTMTAKRTVTFGKACAGCPLRAQCTTSDTGRTITIHPQHDLLRAARAQARTPEFHNAYPTRSNVERIIAFTATQRGRRVKLRYHGITKNDAWLHTRSAAINLRTLLSHGLTRRNGAWILA